MQHRQSTRSVELSLTVIGNTLWSGGELQRLSLQGACPLRLLPPFRGYAPTPTACISALQ